MSISEDNKKIIVFTDEDLETIDSAMQDYKDYGDLENRYEKAISVQEKIQEYYSQ